jgi:rare lipoprotein A
MNLLVSLLLFVGGIKSAIKPVGPSQKGKATYYASKFAGRMTAFGERVNLKAFTAAHRSLPLNTLVEVTNLKTMKSVIVRVNDRGPFTKGHIVDLSHAAAEAIGLMGKGVTNVTLRVLDKSRVNELVSVLTQPDVNQSLMQPAL